MKTIQNKANRPIRVPLPRGKVLHLGPRESGQVHPDTLERPAVKKMLEAGELEVVDDEEARTGGTGAKSGNPSTQGHPSGARMHRKGDR